MSNPLGYAWRVFYCPSVNPEMVSGHADLNFRLQGVLINAAKEEKYHE